MELFCILFGTVIPQGLVSRSRLKQISQVIVKVLLGG